MKMDWSGKRVVIIGAARQGLALARYLAKHGANVTLNDRRNLEEMKDARQSLADLNINWALGDHPINLLDNADVLALSGGVPLDNPLVVEATKRGLPLNNDTQIFLEAVPCKTIGITGSAGKTTTTTLVGKIANEHYKLNADSNNRTRVFVGGNIGDPLINYVDEMTSSDIAILEISSFQLEQTTISPNIAVILNITPNHLDRHGTMEAYTVAKTRIIQFQSDQDVVILGRDDPGAWSLSGKVKGRLLSFGFSPLTEAGEGAFERDGDFYIRINGQEVQLPVGDIIALPGRHNRLNVLAACTIAFVAGFSPEAMRAGVTGFGGVPHRLEFVREVNGSRWYNASIATAPERTIALIRAFDEPLVLMLGGRDKDLPWGDLAALIHQRVDHVVLFGEAAGKICSALGAQVKGQRPYSLQICKNTGEAVQAAAKVAQPGCVVLFAPGGTSFDEFKDFEERGESFRLWVHKLS
jgi:UDP-N-acetylmuramoylalanine--D-glutamate ligase